MGVLCGRPSLEVSAAAPLAALACRRPPPPPIAAALAVQKGGPLMRRTPAQDQAWNYLTVQMNRTSATPEGDPDLFGQWTGGSRGAAVPRRSGKNFDFQVDFEAWHRRCSILCAGHAR